MPTSLRAFTCLVLAAAAFFAAPAGRSHALTPEGDNANAIIALIVKAYGGEAAITEAATWRAEGRINAFMRNDSGTYSVVFSRDGRLRVNTVYKNSAELRILDGPRGWRSTNGGLPEEAVGPRLDAMVYHYKHLDLPYGLMKRLYTLTVTGEEQLGGMTVDVVDLWDHEGPKMTIYVDRKRGYIVKSVGHFTIEGKSHTLSAEYADFRPVGGTVMPFRIINFSGDQRIAEVAIVSCGIEKEPLPDALFSP